MAARHGLRRCLPRPTIALRLDREAAEETFPQDAHDVCLAIKAILSENKDATEVAVHKIAGVVGSEPGSHAVFDASLDPSDISRILGKVCEKDVRLPFEKRSVVHTYYMDSVSYAVEQRLNTDETRVKCWDERCCALDVRPEKGVAISAQQTVAVKPHMFTSRSDVHHAERCERLSVDMTSGVFLQIDLLRDEETSKTFGRAKVVYRRGQFAFPYRAVCRAMACMLLAV